MIIKIILKNIKSSFQSFRKVYLLLIVSQLISIISIFFVYGICSSYAAKMRELDLDSYSIDAYFGDSYSTSYIGDMKKCLPEIMDKLEKKVEFLFIKGCDEEMMISMHNEYQKGEFVLSKRIQENLEIKVGRALTNKDEKNAESVLISGYHDLHEVGDIVNIAGNEFEVVGLDTLGMKDVEIPLNSCPDNVELVGVLFNFKYLPTQKDYDLIKETFHDYFGEKYVMSEFEPKNMETIIAYKTNIIISIAIAVISALNTCLLYGYIVTQRRKQMAVYGIIGASKGRRLAINELEIMLISLATVLSGFLVFRFGLENIITTIYESNIELYSLDAYLNIVTLYIISIFLFTMILLIGMNRERLADMLRRTRND